MQDFLRGWEEDPAPHKGSPFPLKKQALMKALEFGRRLQPFSQQKFGLEEIYKADTFQSRPLTEIFAENYRNLV